MGALIFKHRKQDTWSGSFTVDTLLLEGDSSTGKGNSPSLLEVLRYSRKYEVVVVVVVSYFLRYGSYQSFNFMLCNDSESVMPFNSIVINKDTMIGPVVGSTEAFSA